MITEIYKKYGKYICLSLDELKTKNLNIIHTDSFLQIEDEDTLYCYLNIKGFTPFKFKYYKTLYFPKETFEKIHFEKNAKFEYEKKFINKDGIEFVRLDYKPRLTAHTKDEFNLLIDELEKTKTKKTLLLHSCCGPCSSYCLEYLSRYFDITLYYSNSNIDSSEEFEKRVATQKEIVEKLGLNVQVVVDEYKNSDYTQAIKGLEQLGEFSRRCYNCYKFRLKKTFEFGVENNFDFVSTTLSISPYKNSNWINEIGIEQELEHSDSSKVKFLYSNFKLNDGYKKSVELSKKYNLYRQDYCGCIYSKRGE